MPPGVRIGADMHACPATTGPVPHVGGPILGPGAATVMVMGMPAALMGDACTCVGPPSTLIKGSATVMLMNRPAARLGDPSAHGGTIVGPGAPTVMIGG